MHNKRNLFLILSIALIISLSLTPSLKSSVSIANAQSSSCNKGVVMPTSPTHALPVILIHGYKEDSTVWSAWESSLKHDDIPYCTTFFPSDDKCGSANDHAQDLNQIVQRVKILTHQNEVNIVGHSKGGLDTRVFLEQRQIHDVPNLIMIGTPNGGSPLADEVVLSNSFNLLNPFNIWFNFLKSSICTPALFDLETFAQDTKVKENPFTKYYTIYGNWNSSVPCRNIGSEDIGQHFLNVNAINTPNDGIVPKWSVESLTNFTNLGSTPHCHTDLLSNQEYNMSKSVLISGR
jgi:pimeloyl-ACP methyl ester carboxylesterase